MSPHSLNEVHMSEYPSRILNEQMQLPFQCFQTASLKSANCMQKKRKRRSANHSRMDRIGRHRQEGGQPHQVCRGQGVALGISTTAGPLTGIPTPRVWSINVQEYGLFISCPVGILSFKHQRMLCS